MDPIASNKVATASQRLQLQQLYERALRLRDGNREDLASSCELFRQCFAADPGNLIYAQSWLTAIDQSTQAGGHPLGRFFRSRAIRAALRRGDWPRVIDLASRYVTKRATHLDWFLAIAEACEKLDHEAVCVLVLQHAAQRYPQNDLAFRRLARALTRSGDFSEARRCWRQVQELCPHGREALEELENLGEIPAPVTPETPADEQAGLSKSPAEPVDQCLEQIETLVASGQFEQAEVVLNQAMSKLGNDIRLRQRAEQLLLDRVRYEVRIAEQRFEEQPTAENERVVEGLCRELNRREIDFYAVRSARYPGQPKLKLELGLRLKNAGIFAEAISEFVDLLEHPQLGPVAAIEAGECWQNLRQFDRALSYYRDAVQATSPPGESFKRSRYRAAILLQAMGNRQQAEQLYTEVREVDPGYKDVSERLDKIRQMRHDV